MHSREKSISSSVLQKGTTVGSGRLLAHRSTDDVMWLGGGRKQNEAKAAVLNAWMDSEWKSNCCKQASNSSNWLAEVAICEVACAPSRCWERHWWKK